MPKKIDPEVQARAVRMVADDEIQKRSGIYEFVLDGQTRHLNLRAFPDKDKRAAYEKQDGICVMCKKHFEYIEMAGDHIVPWSKGGKTVPENCQMLCFLDNGSKGAN